MMPVSAPMASPTSTTATMPPNSPSGPAMVVAAITAPRLTNGPMASVIPPPSMSSACAMVTRASGNQFWVNLANPLTLATPGNCHR